MSSLPEDSDSLVPGTGNPTSAALQALMAVGVVVITLVWAMEVRGGSITPWDLWLLPLLSLAVGLSLLAMRIWPAHESSLMLVPTLGLNVYLLVAVHSTLLFMEGGHQRYHWLTSLYWVPLGYGCAFVFVQLRWALVVSAVFILGVFGPLLIGLFLGRLPAWMHADGPLVEVLGLANLIYVCLLTAVSRLRTSHAQARARAALMHSLARTDMLTDLLNRRAMMEELERLRAVTARTGRPFSIGLIDLDHFKSINDSFGHAIGDEVLRRAAATFHAAMGTEGHVARWGGEEFLFCVSDADRDAATRVAQRIGARLNAAKFPHSHPVTVSIGVAQAGPGEAIDVLLARADRALYLAKSRGRNRVVSDDGDVESVATPASTPAAARSHGELVAADRHP